MAKKKGLFVLTGHSKLGNTGQSTGYYLSEVSHPYAKLVALGMDIEFATLKGGQPPIHPSSFDMSDPLNALFLHNREIMGRLKETLRIETLNPSDYRLIFFPGGHGTVFDLPQSEVLARFASAVYENNGVVGAVCHGPCALLNVKLSDGSWLVNRQRINSFTDEEEREAELTHVVPFLLETELKKRGAIFEKAGPGQPKVVVSGRLITGQNPASALGVGEAMANALQP